MANHNFLFALICSAVFHVAVVVIALVFINWSPPSIDLNQTTIQARLVHMGHERDKTLLPRKIEPLAEKPEEKPEKNEKPQPKEVALKPAKNPSTASKNVSAIDALKKRTKKWSDEGNPEGDKKGTALTGDLAQSYEAHIQALIQEMFQVPATLNANERKNLILLINIKINEDGKLVNAKITSPSGNVFFDNAAIAGAKEVSTFGPPPLTLRKQYKQTGVGLKFCPVECPKQ